MILTVRTAYGVATCVDEREDGGSSDRFLSKGQNAASLEEPVISYL